MQNLKKMVNCSQLILITISTSGEGVDHEEIDGPYQDATTPIEAVMAQTGVNGENANSGKEFCILSVIDGKKLH
jgi:hypothetical protein